MQARPLTVSASPKGLSGRTRVPGDKSISHRSLMLASLAHGRTHVYGLLEGEDVLRTADAMRALGATITRDGAVWTIDAHRHRERRHQRPRQNDGACFPCGHG
ncbi:hypothetical protein AD936_11305, partial [Gluconobacter japonicus]